MSRLLDGVIFEFATDRKGVNIDVIKRDLVYCKHCKYASPSYNWRGEMIPNKVKCNYELGSLRGLEEFCSAGELIEEN